MSQTHAQPIHVHLDEGTWFFASKVNPEREGRGSSLDVVPNPRGLGLGVRVGLLVTCVVCGVMAIVSGTQLALELRAELLERQSLLAASLSPLAAQLQTAWTAQEMHATMGRFHMSYLARGNSRHYLAVLDADGGVVFEEGEKLHPEISAVLTASVPLASPSFPLRTLQLVAAHDDSRFAADQARRWRAWAVHIALTALLIVTLLLFLIRREITLPIQRLLGGIHKMELGYWDDMPDPGGAREIRWLGWRFLALGRELSRTVEQLTAAQRRAYAAAAAPAEQARSTRQVRALHAAPKEDVEHSEVQQRLHARLVQLRNGDSRDSESRKLAQIAWDVDAPTAELEGHSGLRICLEDAALRLLEPDQFARIERVVEAQRGLLENAGKQRSQQLHDALSLSGVPLIDISHRIKHVAGIWKKMQQKDLAFDQVHDLLALRIVVPLEADCYHALGVVHDLYSPVVGRFKDYIARPKSNGYRSLHTSVRATCGSVFEVQIRSVSMHRIAEHGDAAHARYNSAKSVASRRLGR